MESACKVCRIAGEAGHEVIVFQQAGGRHRARLVRDLDPSVRHRGITVATAAEAERMFGPGVMITAGELRAVDEALAEAN